MVKVNMRHSCHSFKIQRTQYGNSVIKSKMFGFVFFLYADLIDIFLYLNKKENLPKMNIKKCSSRDDFLLFFSSWVFLYFYLVSKRKIHALGDGCLFKLYWNIWQNLSENVLKNILISIFLYTRQNNMIWMITLSVSEAPLNYH